MSKSKKYRIGIDLGGTKTLVALLDHKFRIVSKIKSKTKIHSGRKIFIKSISENIHSLAKEAKISIARIASIGIGCPGIIDTKNGVVLSSPNIPFLNHFPLANELKKATHLPVIIENDVNTGLYGEHQLGAAQGYRNVIGIFIGTGIGGGLIFNNELYRGSTGAAGEIGHMLLDPLGPLCGCGQHGCIEAMAGRLGIASEAALIAARQKAPFLYKETGADITKIKSNTLRKAIEAGDTDIEKLICEKARLVGLVMANLVNLLNPDLFVLGGGVVEALSKIIIKEAQQTMREHAMKPIVRHVRVKAALLKDDAIIIGAAKLAEQMESL